MNQSDTGPDKSINDHINEGVTLITSTQRLAAIFVSIRGRSRGPGERVWRTPDCLPWPAFCRRSLALATRFDAEPPVLLSQIQQQWLWQDIIGRSGYGDRLLQTDATARQAMRAYRLCREWRIPIFPENVFLSEDAAAFKRWGQCL